MQPVLDTILNHKSGSMYHHAHTCTHTHRIVCRERVEDAESAVVAEGSNVLRGLIDELSSLK